MIVGAHTHAQTRWRTIEWLRSRGQAGVIAVVIGGSSLACAGQRLDDDWKLMAPEHADCRGASSWVSPDQSGGVRIHTSLADALGYSDQALAFGESQIQNGIMVAHDGGWLISVAGPDVPKRGANNHVYWTAGQGQPLEQRSHGRMVAAIDARGVLSFDMCFWYDRGSPQPVDIRRTPGLDEMLERDRVAGPFRGACITALTEDAEGTLWVIVRRYSTDFGPREHQVVDERAHYLARIGPDGAIHYEHELAPVLLPEAWTSPYGAGLSQIVIDGPHMFVSGPGIPARRLTRTNEGWDELVVVPRDCKRQRPLGEHPSAPLPEPDVPEP